MEQRSVRIVQISAVVFAALGFWLWAETDQPPVSSAGPANLARPYAKPPVSGSGFLGGPLARKPGSSKRGVPSIRPQTQGDRSLAAGRFLIASRRLKGPFFAESVILLLEYSAKGALGLVINRRTSALLGDLLPAAARLSERRDRVHIGGPVEPGMMTFLIRSDTGVPGASRIIDGVYATGSAKILRGLIQSAVSADDFRAFVGYSGWGPGQLDNEFSRGDWHVAAARAQVVFDDAPGDLWQRTVVDFEGIQVRRRARARDFARR